MKGIASFSVFISLSYQIMESESVAIGPSTIHTSTNESHLLSINLTEGICLISLAEKNAQRLRLIEVRVFNSTNLFISAGKICRQPMPSCNLTSDVRICEELDLKNGDYNASTPPWNGCILKSCHDIWRQQCSSPTEISPFSQTPTVAETTQFPNQKEEIEGYSGPSFILIILIIIVAHVLVGSAIYGVYRFKRDRFRQVMYTNPCLLQTCFRRQQ